jgi:CSLREA domain-containing protein
LAACGENQEPTAPASPENANGPASSQAAATRVVNSTADPGNGVCNASQCTLREAIGDPASTLITFAPGLTGSINLVRSLVIEKGLTIRGPSSRIVIRRANTSPEFRILRTDSDVPVRLSNLEIRNGRTDGYGGGVINFGALFLTNVVVAGNASSGRGGGIDNNGPLTILQSTISDNSGTGISNSNNHTLSLTNTTATRNTRAGITNSGGSLMLTTSTVSENLDGGIVQDRGDATLERARVVDNSTTSRGGGIFLVQGEMTIRTSTIARNSAAIGGGIANRDGGRYSISRSTIMDNTATEAGGGISNEARGFGRLEVELTLVNSTVSGNSAPEGGGIFNFNFVDEARASLTVTNSTVARNSATEGGGGISLNTGGLTLVNSLVAQNVAPSGPDVLQGDEDTSLLARFNLIGDGSGSGISNTDGNQVGSSGSLIDPRIGPLAQNGGPTRTHALLAGSPAINAASSTGCPARDQRGVARPQGSACDIGSYERE